MPTSSKCPYPDCGHCFDLDPTDSLLANTCPQCGRVLSGPIDPGTAATLDLPGSRRIASPGLATTLAKPSSYDPGQAVTLDLPSARPAVTPPEDNSDRPAPFDRLGRFTIVRFLGEGGFGRVYEAHDPQLDRRIALKVARRERLADEQSVELFLREARAAANLRHPHIVAVFDSGKDGSHYFIASAFIEGQSLDKRLAQLPQGNMLPFTKSVTIIRQLAEALAYAHGRGVMHRDVKPANIMIDEQGHPLLMDFGLAARQAEGEAKAEEHPSRGTPAYMAPEQGRGQAESASDQYSLGCTLYELLTGHTPFGGPPEIQLFLHQTQPPPPLRQVNPAVPLDLEAICLRCLCKEPAERYADCQELADDLRRWLDREPVRARRVGVIERSLKWARRRPYQAALAVSSAIVVALLVFAGWREARDYRLKYESQVRAEKYRSEREDDYLDARRLMTERRWTDARTRLVGIQKGLEALDDVPADALKDQVRESLVLVDRQIESERDREQARDRRKAFEAPFRDAVFRQVPLTGLGLVENRTLARNAARQALAVYGLDAEPVPPGRLIEQLEHDRPLLDAADFARLTGACYELLVIWAESEATDSRERNEPKANARQRGARALALLERAAFLGRAYGLKTQTYYLRKARYQALGREDNELPMPADPDAPRQPTCTLDWFFLGLESYHQAEQLDETGQVEKYLEASQALARAVERQKDHFWAHYLQGLCQLRLGRWREARAALTVCMNLQLDFPWPLVLRGFAASEQGAWYAEQEEQLRKQAHRRGRLPASAEMRRLRHEKESAFALAGADLEQALAQKNLDAQARYVGLVNRGVLFIRQEQWPRAIADLKAAIDVNPAAYQAHANLAQADQGSSRRKEALAAISRAIDCAPRLSELYLVRARMHLDRKDRAAARTDFERAVAREPKTSKSKRLAETLVQLGELLLREEKYRAALAHFERALKVRPDLILTERFRAEALLRLNKNDEAAAALDRYLAATAEPVPEALQARGLLYAGKGKLSAAIEMYSAALRLNVKDTISRGYRGWAYFEVGANRLALDDFEICVREQPRSADYLTGRAVARVRLRDVAGAIADAQAAEKEEPLTDRLCYHLSCVYAQAAAQNGLQTGPGRNRLAEETTARFEELALLLLNRALQKQHPKDRARFWRDRVEKDPALTAVRSGRLYTQLARKYGGDRRER